ncbi:MAG: hypothetical protein OEN01_10500 [Candidatus Krumholzibacteria bacterium]|nr:hypothetical protein [Candidatus Krumholzibacteria bacterium]
MTTVCTTILLLLLITGFAVAATCDSADIARWESERGGTLERLTAIETDMSGLRAELHTLAAQIDDEKAREQSGGPFSRRKLEKLLKESRSTATALERLAAERSTVEAQRDRLGGELHECYGVRVTSLLESMVSSVRAKHYGAAAQKLQQVRELELKISSLEPPRAEVSYPPISEEFIRSSLPSFEERTFLLDTMSDLYDRARRDSVAIGRQLADVRKGIGLKEDLLRLIEEASGAAADGGTFFDEFGTDKVTIEIEELKREEARLASALAAAVDAMGYYRDRAEFLHQLVGQNAE